MNSPAAANGAITPRLWTPPLRDLDDPEASWGYDFITFCDLIGRPLDPWERWLAIHLGELFPNGSPRYRKAIILVARQNGKTLFTRLLILYWMFVERVPEILATSTDRGAAKRSWLKVVEIAERTALLARALPARYTVLQIGEEDFFNSYGSHYRFSAPTRRAGRGDTLHRAVLDELREHTNRDVWDAVVPTMSTIADALLVCISNEGDAGSIVLHEEHDAAELFINTGQGDHRTFLASWSSPIGAHPDSVEALTQANPGVGYHGPQIDALIAQARSAMVAGGETLQRFRIEIMCQRIDQLQAAIAWEHWAGCGTQDVIDLAEHRRSVALCYQISHDAQHASLWSAATIDGITYLDPVAAWSGADCRKQLRAALPGLLAKIRPRKLVWFAEGPAAAVADEWPGRRLANVLLEPIRAEDTKRACMGLEEQAAAGHLRHAHDPLLDGQIKTTQRLDAGNGWVFAQRDQAPNDAVWAAAGAVHAARTIPRLGPAV